MPAGFMIESGQADLMLISYMGIDLLNRGERVVPPARVHDRLRRRPARTVGDTLEYEIRITGHAKHGDVRLFFFEYDCVIGRPRRLTVRDGQAGFFTSRRARRRARASCGRPRAARSTSRRRAASTRRSSQCTKPSFSRDEVVAFSEGRDARAASAPASSGPRRTPARRRSRPGDQLFIDGVTALRPARRAVGPRVHALRDGDRRRRLVLRRALQERPVHARQLHGRGVHPGHVVLPGRARAHDARATAGASSRCRTTPFELKCRGEINPHTEHVAYEVLRRGGLVGPHPTVIGDVARLRRRPDRPSMPIASASSSFPAGRSTSMPEAPRPRAVPDIAGRHRRRRLPRSTGRR